MSNAHPGVSDVPPGWGYDPSAWSERLPILGLALVGFGIASYLALHQWGVVPSVWEPFFGDGSEVILTSSISRILPIPDAALGALGYVLDAVSGAVGVAGGRCPGSSSSSGWRSARWAQRASCS